jgi:hypothetical protein
MTEKTSWNSAALSEADINTYLTHTAGAWDPWTPTVTQLNNLPVEVIRGRSWKAGRLAVADAMLRVLARGVTGQDISIGLPYLAAVSPFPFSRDPIGSGIIRTTTGLVYPVICAYYSGSSFCFVSPTGNVMGSDTYTLPDLNHTFTFTIMYECFP